MAKPPAPPAFNPDGTPKGYRATVAGHASQDEYEVEPSDRRPVDLPRHDNKPSANPATPDIERLHSKHVTPEQETPMRHEPESGKLKSGVESHARYSTTGDTTLFDDSLTRFSENTFLLIAAFAVLFAIIGLLTFGLFSGMIVIAIGLGAALVLAVMLLAFFADSLSGPALIVGALVVAVVAVISMWIFQNEKAPLQQRTETINRALDHTLE